MVLRLDIHASLNIVLEIISYLEMMNSLHGHPLVQNNINYLGMLSQ